MVKCGNCECITAFTPSLKLEGNELSVKMLPGFPSGMAEGIDLKKFILEVIKEELEIKTDLWLELKRKV